MTPKTRLQVVRRQLDYSADDVIRMLDRLAKRLDVSVMSPTSLKTKLSRWENGHESVSEPYRRLFREIYGRTDEELGFPSEPDDQDVAELRARIAVARQVDPELLESFRLQVDHARQIDRRFGGVTMLDRLRGDIDQVSNLLGHSTLSGHREALAGVLTEASTLAGWEALDRSAHGQAWEHYERAKTAAREAMSAPLLAHATAEQAFVLIDIGETEAAAQQLAVAREMAGDAAPSLLRAWLAAAHGEGLSAVGQRDNALRAFDQADQLLPSEPVDPALPFLFLGGSHLDRWRGNALSKLGEAEAIDQLTDALPRLPEAFTRARTGILVDLAFAYTAAGERDAALEHSRQARHLASQIKSDRQLRRLSGLILPGSS
ncbi:tetratricopeptide repeat protein [Saccharopolyspora sp. 6T]|uniref:tetratricopeptide repeat protein n=1 Tax=Saccharopolyspora sp. 6T TaxID=2877238 RepID=UPI001CD3A2E9|nr:tetratricopeptide repeat protein [Saccharopolyspora sp. 6T]MCA1185896.1 tetratricopeptide repeat protein [Saccharopolyspora sp. 6T]